MPNDSKASFKGNIPYVKPGKEKSPKDKLDFSPQFCATPIF